MMYERITWEDGDVFIFLVTPEFKQKLVYRNDGEIVKDSFQDYQPITHQDMEDDIIAVDYLTPDEAFVEMI